MVFYNVQILFHFTGNPSSNAWFPRQNRLDTAKIRVCVSKNPKQTKNSQPTEWTAELIKAQGVAVARGIVGATVPGRP